METPDTWSELSIAPTDDVTAIRRAYAARLKTIDVQADPHAFIALRNAYDAARYGAIPAALEAWSFDGDDAGFPVCADRPRHAEMEAIEALIHGEESREAIFGVLAAQTEALMARADSGDLAASAEIERWIADTIVDGIPRSNGMLHPAITGFRRQERAEDYRCPGAIVTAVDRYLDSEFLRGLQDINPHYRSAWTALTEGTADFAQIHSASMATLLGIIQYQRPGLFEDVDTGHFERWIDFIEWQRKAQREKTVLASVEPVPEPNPIIEGIKDLAYFGSAAALLAHPCAYRPGLWISVTLLVLGLCLLAVGLERRAQRGRMKRLRRAANRLVSPSRKP